jgi:MFS family permease
VNAAEERLLTPRFALIVVTGLAYFLAIGMMVPTVPVYVERSLGGDSLAVGIAVGSFAVGAILLRPFAGRIGDRYGRRILIVGGALIVAAAWALVLVASSMGVLVAARVLGGIGEAAFFVGAGTMVTDLAPESRRGEALSYWSIAVYGGVAFGPAIGVFVLGDDQFSRVWTLAAVLALLAALLGSFTTETMRAPTAPREPGAPRPKLLYRKALAPGLVLFLGLIGLAGFTEFVPLYVNEIGVADAGPVLLVYGLVVLAVRIFGARLPDRLGPLVAGSGALAIGAAGLAIVALVPTPAGLYLGTVIYALGMSQLYPAVMILALTDVPDQERSSAVGTVSSFFDLSQGLGAFVLGGVAHLSGYRGAFAAGVIAAIVGLVLLRSGIDPRARKPIDHAAAKAALETPEPEMP